MPPHKPNPTTSAKSPASDHTGTPVYIPFCASVTEKTVQALTGVIADQVAKGASQINLLIASPGGYSVPAFHLYHLLRSLPLPVLTYATGEIAGYGMLAYLAGDERLSVRAARFLLHAPKLNTVEDGKGPARDNDEAPLQIDPYYEGIVSERAEVTPEDLADINYRQAWKSSNWAKRNGIVTRIAELKIPKGASIVQPSYL